MSSIEDYFLIGDLHTAALVSSSASIDWMCWPRFDSPSIFASILDERAGNFSLHMKNINIAASYINETAIVEFKCQSEQGSFMVEDYMVPQPITECARHALFRKFHSSSTKQKITLAFNPKLNYGLKEPEIKKSENKLSFCSSEEKDKIELHLPEGSAITKSESGYVIQFSIKPGQSTTLKLEYIKDDSTPEITTDSSYQDTLSFWQDWIRKGRFFDFCEQRMVRSAITLKLLQYYPTGALIAAPTTSLPECIGGGRNWDYRFTWIRDSTFTIYAFFILGYKEEARKFFDFIETITSRDKGAERDLRLMYTIKGERVPEEVELKQLSGYKDSRPVRIGNGAANQFQLDTYGIMLDTYYFMYKHGQVDIKPYKQTIEFLADKIVACWDEKDNGIWEVRGERQHYIYSKVICWVGLNRINRLKDELKLPANKQKLYAKKEKEINDWLWQNGYDSANGKFRQHPNTSKQDASTLLFAPLQFLNRHDDKTKQIIKKTCDELLHKKAFVYRYQIDDGIGGDEGAFILCSYWLIASLAMTGQGQEAYEIFRFLEKTTNPQYLLPEEYDPDNGQYLGNYPQAFSHMGYIFSAYYLKRYANEIINGS